MLSKTIAQDAGALNMRGIFAPSRKVRAQPEETDEVLFRSWEVTRDLMAGHSQMEVARKSEGVMEYGIGLMMFRLLEKGHLKCETRAYQILVEQLPENRNMDGKPAPASRRTVLDNLRKNNLIDRNIPVRSLKPAGTTPTACQVLEVTERVMNIPVRDIISKRRSKEIVTARFMAMWVLRNVSGVSFSVIGEHLGGKDHTSVINGVAQIDLRRKTIKDIGPQTELVSDDADYLGITSSMDILLRQRRLTLV